MSTQKDRLTFISYSRINKEFALKLAKELRAGGFYIWLDQLDIPTGARWDDELEKALDACEIFMVILTPASISSENVKDEIGYAIDHKKRILPVLLEDAKVPLRLRRFQYVDFTSMNYDEGVERAKKLLRNLTDEPTLMAGKIQRQDIDAKIAQAAKEKEEAEQSPKQPTPTIKPAIKQPNAKYVSTEKKPLPKNLFIGIGVIIAIALIIGFIAALSGDNNPPIAPTDFTLSTATQELPTQGIQPTETSPPPIASTNTPIPEPSATPTFSPPITPFIRILEITTDTHQNYVVEYETFGYTEIMPGLHIHFFFDTVTPENAGSPGSGPWVLYGGPRPFTDYAVSHRPAGAMQMCALVANDNHTVQQGSGNCVDLP